jgi:hypothetical protein
MPPLEHCRAEDAAEPFDIMKSEVMQWVVAQPELLSVMFNNLIGHGHIVYDIDLQKWKGKLYEP